MTVQITTGITILRKTLHARNGSPHALTLIASEVPGIGAGTLEAFAAGKADLSIEALQACCQRYARQSGTPGHMAAASSLVQRNSVLSTHMRCKMTACRRATATIARFMPRCRAIFMPQALSHDRRQRGHQPAADLIVTHDLKQLAVKHAGLLAQDTTCDQQRFDDRGQVRMVRD